ncbi:HNH endonuclease [Phyllobacterium sp. LjRoot231]|uniref:HNH endonuclease n=1 Tax=Phyllobacterium sp. LjRoot231 TaxID=3342289 RepID=UPI003ECFC785
MKIDQDYLKSVINYDPETGEFTWLRRPNKRFTAGMIAGRISSTGYRVVCLDRKIYRAHRLAFVYMTGLEPPEFVDHIDGDRANNRWENLRLATPSENQHNRKIPSSNTSGFAGVSYMATKRRWRSQISIDGRNLYLGLFASPEDAHAAYVNAKANLHPFQSTIRT